ncbi:MAG: hypothetical protein JKY33_07425, partial [Bacteroidia bacterium]|nr:hypothetical protein [Bacteroidia bacterium]
MKKMILNLMVIGSMVVISLNSYGQTLSVSLATTNESCSGASDGAIDAMV